MAVDPHHVAVVQTALGVPVLNARVPPCAADQPQRRQVNDRTQPARIDDASLAEHFGDKALFTFRAEFIGHGSRVLP